MTDSNPNTRYADFASQRWVICEEVIGNVPDSTPPDSPRSSSVCPAANRVAAAAFKGRQLNVIVGRTDVFDRTGLAAAVGAERLREIMAELVNCASSVV